METLIKIGSDQETPSIFWLGPTMTFVINKPEDMKSVLMSPNCLQKPYMYDFVGSTKGIFNSPGIYFRHMTPLPNSHTTHTYLYFSHLNIYSSHLAKGS